MVIQRCCLNITVIIKKPELRVLPDLNKAAEMPFTMKQLPTIVTVTLGKVFFLPKGGDL